MDFGRSENLSKATILIKQLFYSIGHLIPILPINFLDFCKIAAPPRYGVNKESDADLTTWVYYGST